VGYHPATVSKWLKAGGPPPKRAVNPSERAVDDRWAPSALRHAAERASPRQRAADTAESR